MSSSSTKSVVRNLFALGFCALTVVACTQGTEDEDAAIDGVSSSADLTASITVGATLTTTARVNLREGASTSAEVIRTMPLGATVTVLEAAPKNGFYHVTHNGDAGWAYGAYLKSTGGGGGGGTTPPDTTTPPSTNEPPANGGVNGSFNGRTFSGVTVLWQGNWSYLLRCDSYSRSAGKVVFFCDEDPSRSFVDEGAWVAMPGSNFTRSMCGQMARVCKGSKCIAAKVVEKSETGGQWEGSTAVLKALGVETGFSSCSSSFGTATGATITMQR